MRMAAGKVSLEDWERFTSSFGCSSFFPPSSLPRPAITSLTFILVCVPEPVCQTTSGKCSHRAPERISSAAVPIRSRFSAVIFSGCRI